MPDDPSSTTHQDRRRCRTGAERLGVAFAVLLIALGLALEALAWQRWLDTALIAGTTWHAVALGPLVAGLWGALPRRLTPPRQVGLMLMMLALTALLPLFGGLGLALGLLPGLALPTSQQARDWWVLALPSYPDRDPEALAQESHAIREGLASVLGHATTPDKRQRALLQARHLPLRRAVALIRQGLADESDEVRLLGYSMLNGIESDMEARLQVLKARRDRHGDPLGRIAEAIAQVYADYGYLELAQGSALEAMLGEAQGFLDQALACRQSASRWKFRARLCLLQRDHTGAQQALERAAALGLDAPALAALAAELALHQRRLSDLRRHLAGAARHAPPPLALRPSLEYWR